MIGLLAIAASIGGIGLLCLLLRQTLFGVVVGIQILMLGGALMLSLSGIASGSRAEGQLSGIFIVLGAVAQLAAGSALSLRLFSERNRIRLDSLRTLKR